MGRSLCQLNILTFHWAPQQLAQHIITAAVILLPVSQQAGAMNPQVDTPARRKHRTTSRSCSVAWKLGKPGETGELLKDRFLKY